MNEYINIDKPEIPYAFEVELDGTVYGLEINYNQSFDYFTVDLLKDDTALVIGEKMVLNRPLFRNFVSIDLPNKTQLIPLDRAGNAKRITWDNFNETVFLYVVGDGNG